MLPYHKTIENLIKASYPITWIKTHEEARAESEIIEAAKKLNQKVFLWSLTEGLQKVEEKGSVRISEEYYEPLKFFTYLMSEQSQNGIYVVKDPHPFLGTSGSGAKVTRIFRDIATIFKSRDKSLIVVSPVPVSSLPKELERDITVLEFELPKKDDLLVVLENLINNFPDLKQMGSEIKSKIVESAKGLTLNEADNAFAKAVIESSKLNGKKIDIDFENIPRVVLDEKANTIKKSGILEYFHSNKDISNIGGLENLKHWLSLRKKSFSEKAIEYGLPVPRGALLMGLPGCGKSLTAKVTASILDVPLIRFDLGKVFGGLVGQSEENMREAIQLVERIGSCVLWMDEIEKAFAGMGGSGSTDGGTSQRVFGTFLTWMQEKNLPIFVMATVNRQKGLPPELLRKGRFDEIFFVGLPTTKEREEIFSIHLTGKKRNPDDFDLKKLSKASEGFSGAEIEEAIISGMYEAFNDNERELNTEDILMAVKNTTPLSKSRKEELDEMIEWANKNAVNASRFSDEKLTSGRQLIFSK